MFEKAVVLESPIEFALVGPQRSRDRVLVRSKNSGLDLIGFAAGTEDPFESRSTTDMSFSLWNSRQLNIVKSFPVSDVGYEADSRQSKFRFVWNGLASNSGKMAVEKVLNLNLVELHRALTEENVEDIELALAPVIYGCTRENERRLRSRRVLLIILILYGVILAFTATLAALVSLFAKWKM